MDRVQTGDSQSYSAMTCSRTKCCSRLHVISCQVGVRMSSIREHTWHFSYWRPSAMYRHIRVKSQLPTGIPNPPLLYTSLLRTWTFVCPKTLSIHPRLSLAHCVRVAETLTDNRYLCLSILVPLFTLISYTTACVHASLFYGMPSIASLLSLTSFILLHFF